MRKLCLQFNAGAVSIARPCAQTLFDKIWQPHVVLARDDGRTLLYVDRHLLQDGSAPAFAMLRQRGLDAALADARVRHARPLHPHRTAAASPTCATRKPRAWRRRSPTTRRTPASPMFGVDDPRQGIVHVVAPEQGLSQPGMLIVCGDSHTSTHGALGALAFGIGASEVAHVLATQTHLAAAAEDACASPSTARSRPASARRT